MVGGDKTKACGRGALSSLGPALVDPTGASAVAFLTTSTGFAIGSTYHFTRGSLKLIKEAMTSNREKRAAANTSNIPPAVHISQQQMIEHEFRHLAASLAGCAIQGTLFCVMPHAGVGLAINILHSGCIRHRLSQLSRDVGGKRELMSIVSFRNAGIQVLAGLCLKGTMSTLFLGSELDTFLHAAHNVAGTFSISGAESIKTVQEFHQEMDHLPPFAETTGIASWLPDQYKEHIGFQATFESSNTDRGMDILWTDGVPCGDILTVGALAAASDLVVTRVVEVPLDDGVKKLTSHPNNGLEAH